MHVVGKCGSYFRVILSRKRVALGGGRWASFLEFSCIAAGILLVLNKTAKKFITFFQHL